MAILIKDDNGVPAPQYLNAGGSAYEALRGASGAMSVAVAAALPAGSNSIGTVVLGAGTAAVGTVDTELPAAAALADGTANPTVPLVGVGVELYNGATWDRQRGNLQGTVLASEARTATVDSADQSNYNGRGAHIIINVSSGSGFSVVPKVQAKDPISGSYYDLLVGAAITTTGMVVLRVFPGATAASNLTANDILPRTWRVRMEHGDTTSATYSVAYAIVV